MGGGGEPGHVHTDLGEDALGSPLADAGDGVEPVTGPDERDAGLAGVVPRRRRRRVVSSRAMARFEVGRVVQAQPDEQGVVVPEPAAQRLAQLGDLLAQHALGQLGQHVRVAFAGDESGEHGPAGHAEHVGGDRVQLDARVLQGLLDPLALRWCGPARAACDSGSGRAAPGSPPGARSCPVATPCSSSSASHSASSTSLLRPGRILTCWAFTSFSSKARSSSDVPDRLPERPGGLHHHVGDALGGEPVRHLLQLTGERSERPGRLSASPLSRPRRTDARHHLVLADVHPSAPLKQHVHGHLLTRVRI